MSKGKAIAKAAKEKSSAVKKAAVGGSVVGYAVGKSGEKEKEGEITKLRRKPENRG